MVKLQYTAHAKDDLKHIYNYIASDSVFNAKRFVKALKAHTDVLKAHPEIGSLIYPVRFKGLRSLLYKSYRIVYQSNAGIVTVITIHHQSRLLENISAIRDYIE